MRNESTLHRKRIWMVSSILCVPATVLLLLTGMVLVELELLQRNRSIREMTDPTGMNRILSPVWGILFVSLIVALVSLILSVMKCGQKTADGRVVVTGWFDRIWPDVQLAAAVILSIFLIPSGLLFMDWFSESRLLLQTILLRVAAGEKQIESIRKALQSGYYFFYSIDPKWVQLTIAIAGLTLILLFDLLVIQSVAKRLKNRNFWKSTLIGIVACELRRRVSQNRNLYLKSGIYAAGMLLLSFFCAAFTGDFLIGYLALIIMGLILLYRNLGKFQMVRAGVHELKNGNLDYKIPLSGDGELEQMAADLNAIASAQKLAVERELKNERLKTDLITNVSHDLKTPLTSLISYIDLLRQEGLDSEYAPEYLDILEEKSARLQKLTDDLFEAAKASSGSIPVQTEPVNLVSLVSQAMAEVGDRLEKAGLKMKVHAGDGRQDVIADGRLLWRVLDNLLNNVAKYALPGSRVYIDILDRHDRIRLEMKNISRDPLNMEPDELLERFQRGDTSRNTEGSGLGLTIARDLTRLMGGRFWIRIDGDLFKAIVELPPA